MLLYVAFLCVKIFFRVVSILTVFVNKTLLSSETVNLDAPLFITWFQCIISVVICVTLRTLSQWFPNYITMAEGSPFKMDVVRKVYISFKKIVYLMAKSSIKLNLPQKN